MTLRDKEIQFDSQPVIENDTTLVPVRAIFEALGMEVSWDETTQTVTAEKDGVTITLVIGKTEAKKGKETVSLLTAPIISAEGRTLVPVRFIAESTGYTVDWDAANRIVKIN